MSNLSQFFGGGGPSNVIRGSTSFQTSIVPPNPTGPGQTLNGSPLVDIINTGVFVNASTTYLTQNTRGTSLRASFAQNPGNFVAISAIIGTGTAKIDNSTGEIIVTSGEGVSQSTQQGSEVTYEVYPQGGVVDWEAVEYD